ncbi:MAG: outer membrane protein assembly factor BamD [bacterium]
MRYRVVCALALCTLLVVFSCSKGKKVLTDQDLYNKASDYVDRKKYYQAGEVLDRLAQEYPESPLMAETRLKRADVHFRLKEFDQARAEYDQFLNLHPVHPQAPLSRFRIAMTHFEEILDIDRDQTATIKALESFERFLKEYPQSDRASEAREKITACRERLAEHDRYVARFYLKTGSYRAARGRLRKIWELYPEISWRDEVLFLLAETYKLEGMVDEATYVLCTLRRTFPESPHIKGMTFSCEDMATLGVLP